jgi:Uma2 family endonuclease
MSTTLHELDFETEFTGFEPARFTVDEYFAMISRGAFLDVGRIELLDGLLVRKMTKTPPHRVSLGKTERILRDLVPPGWHVANQEPVKLSGSAPEPDLAIVRGELEDYGERHPGPEDVALLMEIADESLTKDRGKAITCARDGIVEYWIVNLPDRCVERHRQPRRRKKSAAYDEVHVFAEPESIPLVINQTDCGSIHVAHLLP